MIDRDGNAARISGPLTLETTVPLRDAVEAWLATGEVEVDLAAVTDVDSSALSLLLEWRRLAQKHRAHIHYKNLPPNLTSLAVLYGIEDLITEHQASDDRRT